MTAGSSDPLGSIGWVERTGGMLSPGECLTLARPLLREELGIVAGLLAMALRLDSGRRLSIEPARLAPPDSSLARDAQEAAENLLTPVLRNHSHRAYAWAAALAARRGIVFDRELLYLAAMFHHTGLPSPVPHVDFTARASHSSAAAVAARRRVTARPARGGEPAFEGLRDHPLGCGSADTSGGQRYEERGANRHAAGATSPCRRQDDDLNSAAELELGEDPAPRGS